MRPYVELNAHHIGTSHIQSGLACEDYSAVYSDEQVSIIAISDGHGDKNCFRSSRGARYACETAVSLCRQFQSITSHIDDIAQCDFEGLVVSLESDIADAWKKKVLSDASAHPFSAEELSSASAQAQGIYRSGQRLEKAYGCTLILAMSADNYWLTIQIGDGKSIAAYRDGVFVEPVPADENCVGNRSTSLCNSNAKESFRHYYSKVKPAAAFVSSDGVEESFDQAGLYNFFYSIAYWLKEEGLDTAKAKLEALLPQISEGGSGDDVSAAIMISTADALAKPRQTLDQVYERVNACENTFEQCRSLLADVKDRAAEKEKQRAEIDAKIAELRAELEEMEKARGQLAAEQDALKSRADELETRAQRASEQMEKAAKYRAAAERYWFAEFEKIGLKYHSAAEESANGAVPDGPEDQKEEDRAEENAPGRSLLSDESREAKAPEITAEETQKAVAEDEEAEGASQPETGSLPVRRDEAEASAQAYVFEEAQQDKNAKHFW